MTGYCPFCGQASLSLAAALIICTNDDCKNPSGTTAILLQGAETGHLVTLYERTFSIQHPLRERFENQILTCSLGEDLTSQPNAPYPPGEYRVSEDGVWSAI